MQSGTLMRVLSAQPPEPWREVLQLGTGDADDHRMGWNVQLLGDDVKVQVGETAVGHVGRLEALTVTADGIVADIRPVDASVLANREAADWRRCRSLGRLWCLH